MTSKPSSEILTLVEMITSLKDLIRVNIGGVEMSVVPDGSPIFTRYTGYEEIYALNIRWP